MAVSVLEGHVVDVLNALPEKHWHLCVCSPPYWQLRAYGTPPQTWPDGWVGELGQEPTVALYLDHLLDCMEAVRRVLRDDGSLWVNLSGCYFSNPGGQNGRSMGHSDKSTLHWAENNKYRDLDRVSRKAQEANRQQGRVERTAAAPKGWLKPLDYVDVPGLFAHRMQAAGWIWRNDIALVKRSPLPESVRGWAWERCRQKVTPRPSGATRKVGQLGQRDVPSLESEEGRAEWADCPGCPKCQAHDGLVLRRGNGRATRAWERLLVFIKRPGAYWDTEGVRVPNTPGAIERFGKNAAIAPRPKWDGFSGAAASTGDQGSEWRGNGANLRDWLTWEVENLKESHYAAYPPFIPRLAIQAGSSERGCCPTCGAPWARCISSRLVFTQNTHTHPKYETGQFGHAAANRHQAGHIPGYNDTTTIGWRQTCACPPHQPVPCRVLDPFSGAGTTVMQADRLGRDGTGVELQPDYVALSRRRVTGDAPLLVEWAEAPDHQQLSMLDMVAEAAGEG